MKRQKTAARLTVAGLAAVFLISLTVSAPHSRAGAAPSVPDMVTLNGEGSTEALGEVPTWKSDLYGTGQTGLVDLHYLSNSGFSGRQDFLAGGLDYVLSGVPFTSKELAQLPHGASDLIDAPVHVAAMGIISTPPLSVTGFYGITTTNVGLMSFDSTGNGTWHQYSGPVMLPAPNVGAMLLHDTGSALSRWDNPGLRAALGLSGNPPCTDANVDPNTGGFVSCDEFWPHTNDPSNGPFAALRSDPSETNYYLQQFIQKAAPSYWTDYQHTLHRTFDPNSEALQSLVGATRPSVAQQIDWFTSNATSGGNLTLVPPFAKSAPALPKTTTWVQLQNASQHWVAPTVAAINAAVDAGGDSPLYSVTHPDTGTTPAYPLVWVTHLYAPTHGLSITKTEALATTIRYMATAGQDAAAPVGDGRLSTQLKTQALAAADQLVISNCVGPGTSITSSSDPGPYAPASLTKQNIGPMKHCSAAPPPPPPTPSTTAAPTTPTTRSPVSTGGVGSGSGLGSIAGGAYNTSTATTQPVALAAPVLAATASTPPEAPSLASPANTPPRKRGVLTIANLPLGQPWAGGSGWDSLSALTLGALLYLAARKPLRALLKAIRE